MNGRKVGQVAAEAFVCLLCLLWIAAAVAVPVILIRAAL